MSVLSIQSSVAYGHVGNAAAVFCLQRLGFEVWPVNTVQFSNHPGYGDRRGRVMTAEEVSDIVQGIGALGAFSHCRAVLSGYLGRAETAAVVLDAVARVKAQREGALYLCDPVMGDAAEGLYVPADVADVIKSHVVAAADIVIPNAFELALLTGRATDSPEDALTAAEALMEMGPGMVVVTSISAARGPRGRPPHNVAGGTPPVSPRGPRGRPPHNVAGGTPPVSPRGPRGRPPHNVAGGTPDGIQVLAASPTEAWEVATPRLPVEPKGAGDAFAALFLGYWLAGRDLGEALAMAVSSVFAVIEASVPAPELRLVAAQDDMVAPRRRFVPRRIR